LHDHAALAAATQQAKSVAVVFVFDTCILSKLEDRDDRRVSFIFHCLRELDESLKKRNSRLVVRVGEPHLIIAECAEQWKADAVFFNRDYEPYAKGRDEAVVKSLRAKGREVHSFKDHVIFESHEILSGQEKPFKVFTPYSRAWLHALKEEHVSERPVRDTFAPARDLAPICETWDLKKIGFREAEVAVIPGARAAGLRLKKFMKRVAGYERARSRVDLNATSGLSTDLRFGTVSTRECVRETLRLKSSGAKKWLTEIIWRDFFQMLLDTAPASAKKSFRPEGERIRWENKKAWFERWCAGETGYPIVDAAMRKLNADGLMHNRLRMIVASFLTKDLLCDWRWGERYFARKLLDFDLASNVGNWQWCASTGADSQPYFRIFNPVTQSEQYDPEGAFITSQLPELRGLPHGEVHVPRKPIVDHATQRAKALKLFAEAFRR
jgi:deoxyribodipyrimidine photo-lyase